MPKIFAQKFAHLCPIYSAYTSSHSYTTHNQYGLPFIDQGQYFTQSDQVLSKIMHLMSSIVKIEKGFSIFDAKIVFVCVGIESTFGFAKVAH